MADIPELHPSQVQQIPVVVIGLKDIYDAVLKLQSTVDRLVSQQDDHSKDITDHEGRLRSLERGRWPLPSIAALVSVAALIVAVVGRLS